MVGRVLFGLSGALSIALLAFGARPLAWGQGAEPAPPRAADVPAVTVPNFWDPGAPLGKSILPEGQTLRVLTEDDYPPFGFTLPDGTLAGFNVDLARALCDELRAACTVQARRFDTIVPALKAGAGDFAVASLAITPQALREVDFTAPYYRSPARFAARTEAGAEAISPDAIGARRVAVERGTAHEAFLRAFFPDASLVALGSGAEARAALRSGSVDLLFGDGIALAQWLGGSDAAECCRFVGGAYTETRFFGEGAGIAVRKTDKALRAALDDALARLAAKGVYADLYLKYFPVGLY